MSPMHQGERHDPVPAILVIGVIGMTVRTLVAVVSRSSFVYFFQPVLASVAMGCVFLISVAVRRPLIATLAQLSGLGLTAGAVCLTVSMSLRTARREGLHAGPSPLPLPAVFPEPLPYEQLAF
jgi:hypothetical protein